MKKIMNEVKRVGDLETEQNISLEKKFWIIQRIGWMIMLIFVVCAVLGILGGSGVLNNQTKSDQKTGLTLKYDMFLKRDAGSELDVILPSHDSSTKIFVSKSYIDKIQIKDVDPEPDIVTSVEQGYIYSFPSSGSSLHVHFYLWPDNTTFGQVTGSVGEGNRPTITFNQWVYI